MSSKKKILILTQKVSRTDEVLGFFHGWLEEFAKNAEKVTVICLEKGDYSLPDNVSVFSLGKEKKHSRFLYILNFYRHIWKFRHEYDSVFVHMNPEYIVLGGLFWKLFRKKIVLWYVHREVNLKLRIAEFFADRIFTVAKESFGLPSKKVVYVGHGVDTEKFKCAASKKDDGVFKIVSVGRITKIKNLDTLIAAAKILKSNQSAGGRKFIISIIGGAVTEDDDKYFDGLKKKILKEGLGDTVWFKGSVSFQNIAKVYCENDVSVNLTPTGGIDKAVLESMSCGTPTLVSNEAFRGIFKEHADKLIFRFRDAEDLAEKISAFMEHSDQGLNQWLRAEVVRHHGITGPIYAILKAL